MKKAFTQAVLIVLDGWGFREEILHNAIKAAKTPVFDALWKEYPHTLLEASGLAVGLPEGQMGNSEVGHTTIGAGRPLDTDLVRISKSARSGEFSENPVFRKLFDHVTKKQSTLHVLGLLGKGGVHAHSEHLHSFIEAAKNFGVQNIAIHAFTDGRDTPPQSAAGYIEELEKFISKFSGVSIATVTGRFYAMDRDNNTDRTNKAAEAIFNCTAEFHFSGDSLSGENPSAVLKKLYSENKIDEHLPPMIFGNPVPFAENDGVFFFNFRSDRARQLSRKIVEETKVKHIHFATMTEYEPGLTGEIAFPALSIETTLAKEISAAGLTQAHIAETEKFPHATYFLNGGKQDPHAGEEHVLLDSRKDVPTHDLAPKMRAEAIADEAVKRIKRGDNFIFINFANPDMVGHTANVPAIIEAVEEVDRDLGRVLEALKETGGVAFVTADHGNAEVNVDIKTGEKHTSHTINPVPAIITSAEESLRSGGTLADIAPTILTLLGLPVPNKMTGRSLLV